MSDEYDFIVCGGGTSGCVLAARLAENPSFKILLLEAGRDSKDVDTVKMTMGLLQHYGTSDDWNIWSEPNSGINGRRIQCIRGRFLGGSSNINGTICIRGLKQDYDDWNVPGWSGDEVFRYMAKAETFHGTEWFDAAGEGVHGSDGPLHTAPHELNPISKLVMKAFEGKGLEYKGDMFSTGEVGVGCGHAVRSVYEGMRSSAADFVADRALYTDLEILLDATVDKILFDTKSGEGLKATTVEVVMKDGTRKQFKARREIILSGGVYCSPAILLRSGVGPAEELGKLDIPVIHDLPGVGKNLIDHLLVGTAYEVSDPSLTRDSLIYGDGALAKSLEAWQTDHSGALSTFPFGAYAYARLDDRLSDVPTWKKASNGGRDAMNLSFNQPNIEIWNTECYGGPPHWTDFPTDGKAVFCLITQLMSPQSRGSLWLKSKDPMDNPVVDHKYFEVELDAIVLAEGVKLANEIVMGSPGTRDVIKGAWPENLAHHKIEEREEWVKYVRENAFTGYHPAGTCKMGLKDDSGAVVDERLCVHGIDGLRVVDLSIMPSLNQGHTQMPAYAIGEKGADLIKDDHADDN